MQRSTGEQSRDFYGILHLLWSSVVLDASFNKDREQGYFSAC